MYKDICLILNIQLLKNILGIIQIEYFSLNKIQTIYNINI